MIFKKLPRNIKETALIQLFKSLFKPMKYIKDKISHILQVLQHKQCFFSCVGGTRCFHLSVVLFDVLCTPCENKCLQLNIFCSNDSLISVEFSCVKIKTALLFKVRFINLYFYILSLQNL